MQRPLSAETTTDSPDASTGLSLREASRRYDLDERFLRARIKEGSVRAERRPSGRVRWLLDPDELLEDLSRLRCSAPGCADLVARGGYYCSISCSIRKYAREERTCKQCGQGFVLEGHRANDGTSKELCSPRCTVVWRWANAPESFPQHERRGELVTCECGTTRYLSPAHAHVRRCQRCAGEAHRRWLKTPAGRAARGELERKQRDWRASVQQEVDRRKATQDLLDMAEVAQACTRTVPAVSYYVRRGYLEAERHDVDGAEALLFRRADLDRFRREWVLDVNLTPQRQQWYEPKTVIAWYQSMGYITRLDEAERLRERVLESRSVLRKRAGRKPSVGLPDHYVRSTERFDELEDYRERLECAGDPAAAPLATNLGKCRAIAREANPELLPADASYQADRIWKGVKRVKALQNAQNAIGAG